MLLERYVAEALTSRFGHVVEGLDPNKVRLSTWKGELEFHDLVLRPDAIPSDLIEIAHGRIGTLHVKLPWQLVRDQLWRGKGGSSSRRNQNPVEDSTKTEPSSLSSATATDSNIEHGRSSHRHHVKCRVVLSNVNILVVPKRRREVWGGEGGHNDSTALKQGEGEAQTTSRDGDKGSRSGVDREAAIQAGLDAELLKRRFEGQQRRQKQQSAPNGSPSSSWAGSLKKQILSSLLANLVVSVKNIHVRYEDPGTSYRFRFDAECPATASIPTDLPGQRHPPFAAGFLLKQFTLHSTEPENLPEASESDSALAHVQPSSSHGAEGGDGSSAPSAKRQRCRTHRKIVAVEDLAAYWDSDCCSLPSDEDQERDGDDQDRRNFDTSNCPMTSAASTIHTFVLDPFSPRVEFTITEPISSMKAFRVYADDLRSVTVDRSSSDRISHPPPSLAVITLPPCRFSLSRNLLQDLGYLRQSFGLRQAPHEELARHATHLKRPVNPPGQDPRAWWRFTIQAVLVVQRSLEPRGWALLARAVKRQARYVVLYRTLRSPSSLDGDDGHESRRLEAHRSLLHMEQNVLTVQEVVAFRVAVCRLLKAPSHSSTRMQRKNKQKSSVSEERSCTHGDDHSNDSDMETIGSGLPVALSGESILSVEHRLRMLEELIQALDQEFLGTCTDDGNEALNERSFSDSSLSKQAHWIMSLSCPEISLQVTDRQFHRVQRQRELPVARLSCALFAQHRRNGVGSWEVENKIGSLRVQDCIASHEDESKLSEVLFPNLISNNPSQEQSMMELNGEIFYESVHIVVKRVSSSTPESGRLTTTSTWIRVLPLEIVYSTAPVEALIRILSVANVELSDDYVRLGSRLYEWREKQRMRIVQALAHKEKRIVIDVDVGAPVVLIPEDCTQDSPMLIVDLGRLLIFNDTKRRRESSKFDDNWCLEVKDLQVQCSSTYRYREITYDSGRFNLAKGATSELQQVVEPFNLEFAISTRFEIQGDDRDRQTSVQVFATLPRLGLNVTSSAIRLMLRLRVQWERRRLLHRSRPQFPRRASHLPQTSATQNSLSDRQVEFRFVAPVLLFRFGNDVDGRDCVLPGSSFGWPTTPLVELVMKGIDCRVMSTRSADGSANLCWTARLRALYAIDMYQKAGEDFLYLLSSAFPDLMIGSGPRDVTTFETGMTDDLVRFSYESNTGHSTSDTRHASIAYKLSVIFSELYVEWNPETLSALFFAMKLPVDLRHVTYANDPALNNEESFFDAEEEEFFDARSCYSSSPDSDIETYPTEVFHAHPLSDASNVPFVFEFALSKLRVHFNKESRHRRLLVVDMDRTFVHRTADARGESTTKATIGNLTLSDADYAHDKTLYREILGLKTDSRPDAEGQSSLLEMELRMNARSREYTDHFEETGDEHEVGTVKVDLTEKRAHGYDTFVKATFSPMRFVYLQQAWFEIIDYFFEGIVGYEVWGNHRSTFVSQVDTALDAPNADRLSFTLFDIVLNAPTILIPVSYCSTDYLRLEATSVAVSNFYRFADMRHADDKCNVAPRLQWFNDCTVHFSEILLLHGSGRKLSRSDDRVSAVVSLNWPSGPTATLNAPKWQIRCSVEEIDLNLLREDYTLIQHIIQHNIGEESRHFEEWNALQNLPPLVLQRYKEDIRVQFGYDKKDVAPTTFDAEVSLPFVSFRFDGSRGSSVATLYCEDVVWSYRKFPDLISRQKVTCDLEIMDSTDLNSCLLSSQHRKSISDRILSDLTYTSTTKPNGDNVRALHLADSRVNVVYSSWQELASFFAGMPQPTFLSPKEVIQVGDRWYKIDSKKTPVIDVPRRGPNWLAGIRSNTQLQLVSGDKSAPVPPTFQFQLLLRRPSLILGTETSSIVLLAEEVAYGHIGRSHLVERDFRFVGVKVQTTRSDRPKTANESYLTDPWFLCGEMRRCNGSISCECPSHTIVVSADKLSASASFSDLTIMTEAGLYLARCVRDYNARAFADKQEIENVATRGDREHAPPKQSSLDLRWDGLRVTVVDDSLRHFAKTQELVIVSLGPLDFRREEQCQASNWNLDSSTIHPGTYLTRLRFTTLDVTDSLQSPSSPFRTVLTVRSSYASIPHDFCPIGADGEPQFAVELSSMLSGSREYSIKVGSVDIQYNPSLVIALQRFLGRTSKDVRSRLATVFDQRTEALEPPSSESGPPRDDADDRLVCANFSFEHLRLCLNKEHQGRQLLETIISDGSVDVRQSTQGLVVGGHLGLFEALHNLNYSSRNVVKVGGEVDKNFLDFRYVKLYSRSVDQSSLKAYGLPNWVISTRDETIDDCLSLGIASVDIVFDKALSLEIIDYLSNGMPGRGMGMTSRVAKGFVSKRIQSNSFLQVNVDSPRLFIPEDINADTGIVMSLGDLNMRSWINSKRFVAVSMTGLSTLVYGARFYLDDEKPICSEIDVRIEVEKSQEKILVRSSVTPINLVLHYGDWVALLTVLRANIGGEVDKSQWDNLEVAWEHDDQEDAVVTDTSPRYSKEVVYAENARHVRFGMARRPSGSTEGGGLDIDVKLDCPKLSLMLRHEDLAFATGERAQGLCNVALLVVHRLASSFMKSQSGIYSASFSIGEIFLFDLGARRRFLNPTVGQGTGDGLAASHSVLIEGYEDRDASEAFDSQIVFTFDSLDASSSEVNVSLLMNYISLAVLTTPIEEVVQFLTCRFDAATSGNVLESNGLTSRPETSPSIPQSPSLFNTPVQLKLVLHYPRLVIVAEENDRNSRALVLEGLAMVNASMYPQLNEDDPSTLRIHADFLNVSSYINPDASSVTGFGQRHSNLASDLSAHGLSFDVLREDEPWNASSLRGVPLLLPFSLGLEFEQNAYTQRPTSRNLAATMDSLSVMVSSTDIHFIESVMSKWSRKNRKPRTRAFVYSAVFETDRLGLGLRKEGSTIVVDHVSATAGQKSIERGDVIQSINGVVLSDSDHISLSGVVEKLTALPRPLTVTFSRSLNHLESDEVGDSVNPPVFARVTDQFQGSFDVIDFTLSSAIVTFVNHELTLLRGIISSVEAGCKLTRTDTNFSRIHLATSLEIDYYNLRLWCWEPLLEAGFISVSAEVNDPLAGPREVSIEVGDRSRGPLSVNLSDSAVESLAKLSSIKTEHRGTDEDRSSISLELDEPWADATPGTSVTTQAANAALLFAQRQLSDSAKPFVFRNRTGVSVAFVLERKPPDTERHIESNFLAIGEYSGLQMYRSTDVTVVANNEEINFRAELLCDDQEENRGRLFPRLTVSLQAVEDRHVAPLSGLDISSGFDAVTFPISYVSNGEASFKAEHQRNWLSWSVEQFDERTVLTLATSIRIVSLLNKVVEVGIQVAEIGRGRDSFENVRVVGSCSASEPLYLPVWLAIRSRSWRCSIKAPGCRWTTLFTMSTEGDITEHSSEGGFVECQSETGNSVRDFLAVTIDDVESLLTVTLDCAISMRNLLPLVCDWEMKDEGLEGSSDDPFFSFTGCLESGNRAEVFPPGHEAMQLRICLPPSGAWSTWASLSTSAKQVQPLSTRLSRMEVSDAEFLVHVTHEVRIVDSFGVPLTLAVRISEKRFGGIEVVIYADLWVSNCSSLPLAFGYTKEPPSALSKVRDPSFSDISAAEAALREITMLFELGEEGKKLSRDVGIRSPLFVVDVYQLPFQRSTSIIEECFEYIEVDGSTVLRRWWASENPHSLRDNLTLVESDGTWEWLDSSWSFDEAGRTVSGWESSSSLEAFSDQRGFDSSQRYRRRRWTRSRSAEGSDFLDKVSGFFRPLYTYPQKSQNVEKPSASACFRVALKVDGGKWAMTSMIPQHGTSHGALRALRARWPRVLHTTAKSAVNAQSTTVFELCYAVSPLDGIWGEFSRILLVTDRFLLRNDSKDVTFEIKQSGADDRTSVRVSPGDKAPFHWSNANLPELISVRPLLLLEGDAVYQWSGGFDPLSIGALPVRIRTTASLPAYVSDDPTPECRVHSIQVESEIRPRTGGTGININFREEDQFGSGALFRVENHSRFPIWFTQDGILANHSGKPGDLIKPSESNVFALDVPFRQGKYVGRKAATVAELLRVCVSLAPLFSRAGIETTKVISLASAGERIRLNPSKLMFLDSRVRASLNRVRILGIVINDGPTRVLRFCLMIKSDPESIFSNPFQEDMALQGLHDESTRCFDQYSQVISDAASESSHLALNGHLPAEDEAAEQALFDISRTFTAPASIMPDIFTRTVTTTRDYIVSFRAAFQGMIVSAIDNAPSEICVVSAKNLNVLASWNTQRTTTSTIYFTVTSIQVDNMLPNAPFPVAVCPSGSSARESLLETPVTASSGGSGDGVPPLLVVGVSVAPRHSSGIVCLRSVTVAPRNLSIRVDLAFLVRLQKYFLDLQGHFRQPPTQHAASNWSSPDVNALYGALEEASASAVGRQKFFFGGLTIMPCNIKLSVAPARALTSAQAALEGEVAAALHQAVRKGDVKFGDSRSALLGVRVGHTNSTPLAVVRGVFKSIVVDALLRLDGAKLNFAGVSLLNHISTSSQLSTHLGAHYLASLRQNLPALVGSLSVFGNPLGLVRGLGDGVSDFVLEPVRGFQRSLQEMDASYLVDGVARGTLSLARHTVGGFADSAALLMETFSKNMTVLTLDRRYAQKRDRKDMLRDQQEGSVNVATGIGSGMQKLAQGFIEGVTGVVKAPLRGAEKKGFEGFAKGIGKGLLGLLVKPIIGISDGLTDFMIGVKGSVEGSQGPAEHAVHQIRPRRALYGSEMRIRPYNVADAAAAALMLRTRLAGEHYLAHMDMGNRVALLSVSRLLLLGDQGDELLELLVLKYKHIDRLEVRAIEQEDGSTGWAIIVVLSTRRRNGSEVEVINCKDKTEAEELAQLIEQGMKLVSAENNEEQPGVYAPRLRGDIS